MNERGVQVLKGLGLTIAAAALTWALSWFMQYVASITIPHPARSLHITSPEANRLALVTVLATVVVMVAIVLLRILDGYDTFILILLFGGAIETGIGSVALHTFPATTVSTRPAQIVYGIVVVVWGILMWYVFLNNVTGELAEEVEEP